jgi:hypothetical protein
MSDDTTAIVNAAVLYVGTMTKIAEYSVAGSEAAFLELVRVVEAYVTARAGTGTPTPCVAITPDE